MSEQKRDIGRVQLHSLDDLGIYIHKMRNWKALLRSAGVLAGAEIGAALGAITIHSKLYVKHYDAKREKSYDYGLVGARKITQAGVVYLVAAWQAANSTLGNFKYHGCGTGTNSESNADTALQTECTTVLNPDSTRATGSQTVQSGGVVNNILQSVGTLTFDGSATVTEHGLLSQAATGGGTLWDRTVFTGISVVTVDTMTFTYQCTVSYEA